MIRGQPFPPSFGDSAGLYAYALGSIFCLACIYLMTALWIAGEIWRDRRYVHPKTALTAYRVIVMLAATTGFIRSAPEAIYMMAWNEVSASTIRAILFFKRMADSFSIIPGSGWIMLLVLSYPAVANALKNAAVFDVDLFSPWPKLVRPAIAMFLIMVLSVLVAIGKFYTGVPIE